MTDMIWSFAPWMVFLTGVRLGDVYWGAGTGAIVAIVVLARALTTTRRTSSTTSASSTS